MHRRSLILAALAQFGLGAPPRRRYRAAVIGHTGHGNYGHGLDIVWKAFDWIEVVAVADPDEAGRAKAQQRTGAARAYADYQQMLRREKPDLVSIGPRWLDQRVAMIEAACAAGSHIYTEKPFARDLEEADRIVAAVRRHHVKLQIAHQMRGSPFLRQAHELVRAGEIGLIQEVRCRGKEDHRAGGEDLMVLGSHLCDVMRIFLGDPKWVFAHVTEDGEELAPRHTRRPTEPIGPVAGNQIAAMFAFAGGLHAYLASKACPETHPLRFGTQILGSKGVIFLPNAIYPDGQPYLLRSPAWFPDAEHSWEKIPPMAGLEELAEHGRDAALIANALMVRDLIDAIERDRKPLCDEEDGRWTIEMISGVYQSQKAGRPVAFPLAERRHPLS